MLRGRPNTPFYSLFRATDVPQAFYTLYNPDWTVKQAKTEADSYQPADNVALAGITLTTEWTGIIKWENDDASVVEYDTVEVRDDLNIFEGAGQ